VLNAARLDEGQIQFTPEVHDLVELVSDACERQRELSPGFSIQFEAPEERIAVNCDGLLVEQVVANLLSNAVKYSGRSGRIAVRLCVEGNVVRCSVRDWGIGIPADEVSRIFDRFYRARTASGIAGTGIGLDVARQISRLHGGDIAVESREGEGSTFIFTMPVTGAEHPSKAA
jgi:signal transduction histidine kinase